MNRSIRNRSGDNLDPGHFPGSESTDDLRSHVSIADAPAVSTFLIRPSANCFRLVQDLRPDVYCDDSREIWSDRAPHQTRLLISYFHSAFLGDADIFISVTAARAFDLLLPQAA